MTIEKRVVWSPEKTYRLLSILHHVLVMLDDWVCEVGEFSRRPKGKYAEEFRKHE